MKPAQTPIYRAAERLLLWAIPVTERLPKSLPYQTLGGLLIRDIRESLDAIAIATLSRGRARLECLDILTARMTAVKTTMRVLTQIKRPCPDGVKHHHIISARQEAGFLDLVNPIATQAGAWRAKTVADMDGQD